MAFAESDRVQIRKYLGYPQIWLQADPRLESAITNIQSVNDTPPGTRPDGPPSSAEVEAKATITSLQAVDAAIAALRGLMGGTTVDEVKVDAFREDIRLRTEGRMYVARLAHMFDTEPQQDVYSSASSGDDFRGRGMSRGPFGGRIGY